MSNDPELVRKITSHVASSLALFVEELKRLELDIDPQKRPFLWVIEKDSFGKMGFYFVPQEYREARLAGRRSGLVATKAIPAEWFLDDETRAMGKYTEDSGGTYRPLVMDDWEALG